jgi:hypothetical protein
MNFNPKFINGHSGQKSGREQTNIKKGETVTLQVSEENLTGQYVVAVVHSHPLYRPKTIHVLRFGGYKEDAMKNLTRFPLRAWTDSSSYHITRYCSLIIPKLGLHHVAIVHMKDDNVINLRFPMLSFDRGNFGNKKHGRLWELIIFPYDKLKSAYEHWSVCPIQIVAELRDPNKSKNPKRYIKRVIQQPLDTPMEDMVNNPQDMNETELINMILWNTKKHAQLLPRDHLILIARKSIIDYETALTQFGDIHLQ